VSVCRRTAQWSGRDAYCIGREAQYRVRSMEGHRREHVPRRMARCHQQTRLYNHLTGAPILPTVNGLLQYFSVSRR